MKIFLKNALNFVFTLLLTPLLALYFLLARLGSPDSALASFSQFLSLFPGKLGSYLRKNFYALTLAHCDRNTLIGFGTIFSHRDTEIGRGTYIGPQCNIGKSKIGAGCLFGSGVHILSGKGQHNFDDIETPIQEQGGQFVQISIGEDTWIGNGTLVLCNIGKKCVIGAGSVVINDIPDYSIAAGNPAKIIKSRSPHLVSD